MSEASTPAKRRVLRIQVSFWRLGDPDETHIGFTTDASASGVFIASNSVFPPGTEIGMMIEDSEGPFVFSGVVARAVKVHPSMQRVKKSGMGIQFDDEESPGVQRLNAMGQEISGNITY